MTKRVVFRRWNDDGSARFNPGQWKFLVCLDPYSLLAGGVGSGKTTALAAKIIQLRQANWGFPGLLVAPTLPMLKSVTLREFRRVYKLTFPDKPRPKLKDPSGDRHLDFRDGGAPLFLRTATNPESIEGFSVGYAAGDEARWWRTHEAYRNLIARVRLKAPQPQVVLSSTPAIGWMSDEFASGKAGRSLIIAPTRENIRNLRDGYLEDLKVSFSPRVQRAILEGEFIPYEGVVYEAFDGRRESEWIVDWEPEKKHFDNCKVTLAVDPGWRRSSWFYIMEIRPLEWVVFDQMILDNTSDMSAVQMVNERGYPIDEIWVDPAAEAHQSATGLDTRKVLRHVRLRDPDMRGIRILSNRYRDIAWGVDKVRVLLGGYEGYPRRIRFTRKVLEYELGRDRGIVKDLSCYRYHDIKDGKAISDMPLKDGLTDHSCDAIRYFCAGVWLSIPQLRLRDPDIAKSKHLGYKIAA